MESTAEVTFISVVQGTQILNSPGGASDRMNARLMFSVTYAGATHRGGTVELNQPYGTPADGAPFECTGITLPASMPRRLRHDDLCAAAESYYRSQIGSSGAAFRVGGASNVKMEGNIVIAHRSFPVRIAEDEAGW